MTEAIAYLPQSDRAASDVIWPLWSPVIRPWSLRSFAAFVTQETYLPWFFHGSEDLY